MNITWNAKEYKDHFSFVPSYGEDLFSLIDAPARSRVVDLGCGNGALTQKLSERGFSVLGLDASGEMLALAKELHPGLEFRLADATSFHLEEKADVIFSNAVFHWIDDQRALLRCIADNLKPGGQLVCEFGGVGCAKSVHDALSYGFAQRGLSYSIPFYFPTIGEYAPLLEEQGLRVCFASLFDRPTPQEGPDGLINWIHMFDQKPFSGISDALTQEILKEAASRLRPILYQNGRWIVDYVRIRIKAIKL